MKLLIGALGIAMVSATVTAQLPVTTSSNQSALLQSSDQKLAANKKLVFDFWREVFQTHDTAQAARYMAEDYIQHNPNVPTGRQAFMNFFGGFPRATVKPEIDNLVTRD